MLPHGPTPTRNQLISRSESMEEDARWIAVITGGAAGEAREESFRKLMVKYWKLVTLLALQKVRDREEAEDVAQEAFFRAFRSIGSLHDPDLFLGWLLRIVRNPRHDHRARGSRPCRSTRSPPRAIPFSQGPRGGRIRIRERARVR